MDAHDQHAAPDPVAPALAYLDALFPGDKAPRTFVAPGRVNLIGEHTDYNGGFVLPAAIDRAMALALRPRDDGRVIVSSLAGNQDPQVPLLSPSVRLASSPTAGASSLAGNQDPQVPLLSPSVRLASSPTAGAHSLVQNEPYTLELADLQASEAPWGRYVTAVARLLRQRGHALTGFEGVLASTVPPGSGLSSSAALTGLFATTFRALGGWDAPVEELAELCQQAELDAVGVRCGIMDQLAVLRGRAGHALFIDCRALEVTAVPLPGDEVAIVVCDSGAPRTLAGSAYNQRRQECEEGVRLLRQYLPDALCLRDVPWKDFLTLEKHLPEPIRRRCRHVISENYRVHNAVTALDAGDWESFGRLFYDSHESLRDDYEVSGPELDLLVEAARAAGALGARLTGAGFGGCTVNLVPRESLPAFAAEVGGRFLSRFGRRPPIYACRAVDGAGEVQAPPQPPMQREEITREDGRYLLYYRFPEA